MGDHLKLMEEEFKTNPLLKKKEDNPSRNFQDEVPYNKNTQENENIKKKQTVIEQEEKENTNINTDTNSTLEEKENNEHSEEATDDEDDNEEEEEDTSGDVITQDDFFITKETNETVTTHPLPQRRTNLNTMWRTRFLNSLFPDTIALENTNMQKPDESRKLQQIQHENYPIGSPFANDHNSFRIWNINANTITTKEDFSELHELCLSLNHFKVSAVGFQEVNLDLMDIKIRNNILSVFKQHFKSAQVLFSTTPIRSPGK